MGVTDLRGWTPTRVTFEAGRPVVEWRWLHGVAFAEPFFDQTVDRALRDPYRLLFVRRTPIEVLGEWAAASPSLVVKLDAWAALDLDVVLAAGRRYRSVMSPQ